MIKRLRWLVTGAAIGLGGSAWLKRKAKTVTARYGANALAEAAANRAREAFEEGREAMRQREAELRGRAPTRGDRGRHGAGTAAGRPTGRP